MTIVVLNTDDLLRYFVDINMPGFHDPDARPLGPAPSQGLKFDHDAFLYLKSAGQTWEIPVSKGDSLLVSLSRIPSAHFTSLSECDRRPTDN